MAEWKFGQESGSGKETKVVLVTRVMKEATNERMAKLIDEIKFLEKLPQKWRQHFPQIIFAVKGRGKAYYEMPHYPYPTLRKLIFTGAITESETVKWLDKILKFYFSMMEEKKLPVYSAYMKYIHTDRLRRRLAELSQKSKLFSRIISKETIQVNGRRRLNILTIYKKLIESGVLQHCKPLYLSPWVHSDLHFSNIMLDLEHDNFILLDPRGYKKCDYYYDFGKLWHSVNGKYEMIAERYFTLNNDYVNFDRGRIYNFLESLKQNLYPLLLKHSSESAAETLMKTEFNEAIHFASLVPFLLDYDGVETRTVAAYYTATELLNNFYFKWVRK